MIDDLKKEFDQLTINNVEKRADFYKERSLGGRKDFIKTLYYLKHTSRFRENKVFKSSTFEQYVNTRHSLRLATFEREAWAFFKFPVASEHHGTGLINKIRTVCGSENVPKIIEKIEALPKPDMQKINKVINANEIPERKKRKADERTRPTIKSLQSALDKAQGTIQAQTIELKEAYARIKTLKATAESYKEKYDNLLKVVGPVATFIKEDVKESRANA